MDTNVWAPILWTQLAWRAWMAEHGGAVINTASLGGLTREPELGVYNVTKAALIHLTRQLALELAPKVRVNAVAPGVVRTRLSEALWKERRGQRRRHSRRSAASASRRTSRAPSPSWPPIARAGSRARRW